MSPAMIVFAGSSVVGATLRANLSVPPRFGDEARALRVPERLTSHRRRATGLGQQWSERDERRGAQPITKHVSSRDGT